ncbi:hypothetical protein Bca4012_019008 [Brassica carinata]
MPNLVEENSFDTQVLPVSCSELILAPSQCFSVEQYAAVRGEDGPAELQQKLCQGAVVIVNACDLQELIRHGQLLME